VLRMSTEDKQLLADMVAGMRTSLVDHAFSSAETVKARSPLAEIDRAFAYLRMTHANLAAMERALAIMTRDEQLTDAQVDAMLKD